MDTKDLDEHVKCIQIQIEKVFKQIQENPSDARKDKTLICFLDLLLSTLDKINPANCKS